MSNLQVRDGSSTIKYLKATGTGTDLDPNIPEHKESNSAAILAALGGTLAVSGTVTTGGLTDAQLRATAVPVSGPVTDAQLRATPVPVSGTVTASGPLTDAQLRNSAVPVSGPLTDAQLRATPVPVSGPVTDAQLRAAAVPVSGTVTPAVVPFTPTVVTGYAAQAGNNAIIAAPGAGKTLDIYFEQVQNATATATAVLIKHGSTVKVTLINANKGDGYVRDYGSRPYRMAENTAYNIDLDLANSHAYKVDYLVVTL